MWWDEACPGCTRLLRHALLAHLPALHSREQRQVSTELVEGIFPCRLLARRSFRRVVVVGCGDYSYFYSGGVTCEVVPRNSSRGGFGAWHHACFATRGRRQHLPPTVG